MRVLVVTTVHVPADARISRREIGALVESGAEVTYAAPFRATGTAPPVGVRAIDLPRSAGRRRLDALRAAHRVLRAEAPHHDVVLLHDPELMLAAIGLRGPVVVWDVHEDTAAALSLKPWLPKALRGTVAAGVHGAERVAESRFRLLLAEDGYRTRFRRPHPVVPNSTPAPPSVLPPGADRVVYVGHLTAARGAAELVATGRLLAGTGVTLHVVGHADGTTTDLLRTAADENVLTWHGFVPNEAALPLIDGALAGLSLLHDEPNYQHSRPTKILEYMAHGVPVVTTPTLAARELVEAAGCGLVVPFGDTDTVARAAAAAVLQLRDDLDLRLRLAEAGRAAALRDHDWNTDGPEFVATLQDWAKSAARR
ncbi:MAG TPA: glycosyltransferase [Candidatus Nanopelagicales bacterium]|jgi:glycosyltransferase involved in cell wall biosynthesis